MRTVRTIALMLLVPPVLFLALAHTVSSSGDWYWAAVGATIFIGLAAIATSRWGMATKAIVGTAYVILAVATPLLGLLALVAVCTTGNCI